MIIQSKAIVFGDNVNTDVIIPARYLSKYDKDTLAKHCMEDIRADFNDKCNGDGIVVAGDNFGSGSSREHAPMALAAAGVRLVIAKSFARIFLRNSINIGLPLCETPDTDKISEGDILRCDLEKGLIRNLTKNENYKTAPFPPFISGMISEGGLIGYIKANKKDV